MDGVGIRLLFFLLGFAVSFRKAIHWLNHLKMMGNFKFGFSVAVPRLHFQGCFLGISKNRGGYPKMDGENKGKPY